MLAAACSWKGHAFTPPLSTHSRGCPVRGSTIRPAPARDMRRVAWALVVEAPGSICVWKLLYR